jgi:hypothetical protein
MAQFTSVKFLFPLFAIALTSLVVTTVSGDVNQPMCGGYRWYDGSDPTGDTYYDWYYCMDNHEVQLKDYYHTLHVLTGWDIPIIEYLEKVSPEDLATMPPEMREHFRKWNRLMFAGGSGTIDNGETLWYFDTHQHVWISPEGNVFNGNFPPYQFLVWKGWEAYADQLPQPPDGAPFPPLPYTGTPKNTLPFAKVTPIEFIPGKTTEVNAIQPPCPAAISVNPMDLGDWEWTYEMQDHLGYLGLDTDMGKTRLGYEKSGATIRMVGMTPSGTMREWTLKLSKGAWTCDPADARELEAMLFILEKIGAIFNLPASVAPPAAMEGAPSAILKTQVMASRSLPEVPSISSLKGQFPDRKNAVIDPVVNATVLAQRPATVVQTAGRVSYQANVKRPEIITSIPAPSVPDLPLHVKYPGIPSRIPSRTAGSR